MIQKHYLALAALDATSGFRGTVCIRGSSYGGGSSRGQNRGSSPAWSPLHIVGGEAAGNPLLGTGLTALPGSTHHSVLRMLLMPVFHTGVTLDASHLLRVAQSAQPSL